MKAVLVRLLIAVTDTRDKEHKGGTFMWVHNFRSSYLWSGDCIVIGPSHRQTISVRKATWKRDVSPRQLRRKWRNVGKFQSPDVAFKGKNPGVYLSQLQNITNIN